MLGAEPPRRPALPRRGGRHGRRCCSRPVVVAAGLGPRVGPARRLPADRLPRLPGAAVPARLRRAAEHRLAVAASCPTALEPLLLFYLPLVLVVGAGRGWRSRCVRRRDPLTRRHRPCSPSACSATCSCAPTCSTRRRWPCWSRSSPRGRWRRGHAAASRSCRSPSRAPRSPTRSSRGSTAAGSCCARTRCALHLPVADGVRVPPREAAELEAAVRAVAARVPPGQPIYVAPRRGPTSSPPATRCSTCSPTGRTRPATTSPRPASSPRRRCSARSSRDLERTRPPVVVRWESPLSAAPEPNAAGRSSGVRLLDDYLARALRAGPALRHAAAARRAGPEG